MVLIKLLVLMLIIPSLYSPSPPYSPLISLLPYSLFTHWRPRNLPGRRLHLLTYSCYKTRLTYFPFVHYSFFLKLLNNYVLFRKLKRPTGKKQHHDLEIAVACRCLRPLCIDVFWLFFNCHGFLRCIWGRGGGGLRVLWRILACDDTCSILLLPSGGM